MRKFASPLADANVTTVKAALCSSWMNISVNNRVFLQAVKNVLSMSEKEITKQNNMEKFEIREQNKNKTEAKWKYKVRPFQLT